MEIIDRLHFYFSNQMLCNLNAVVKLEKIWSDAKQSKAIQMLLSAWTIIHFEPISLVIVQPLPNHLMPSEE